MEISAGPAAVARTEDETRRDASAVAHWVVVGHPFNAAWYPQLVGYEGGGEPPSYVIVQIEFAENAVFQRRHEADKDRARDAGGCSSS